MSDSLWPHGLLPTSLLCLWDFPGKNAGMSCHFLLQGIFLDQGSNPQLLHWQTNSFPLSHQGSSQDFFSPSNNTTLLWGGGDHLLGVGIRVPWNSSWRMLALYTEKCRGAHINPRIHKWIACLSFPSWVWGGYHLVFSLSSHIYETHKLTKDYLRKLSWDK